MTRVPGLKTYINEYNVHAEILASGFGVNNPQHVDLLKSVFQGDENAVMPQHLTDDRFITNIQISLMVYNRKEYKFIFCVKKIKPIFRYIKAYFIVIVIFHCYCLFLI